MPDRHHKKRIALSIAADDVVKTTNVQCLLTCAFLAAVDVLRQVHSGETSFTDYFTKYVISVRSFRRLALAVIVCLLLDHTVVIYFLLLLGAVMVRQLGRTVMIRLPLLPVGSVFLHGRVCNNTRRCHCHAHVMLLWRWQCGMNSLQQKENKHETMGFTRPHVYSPPPRR